MRWSTSLAVASSIAVGLATAALSSGCVLGPSNSTGDAGTEDAGTDCPENDGCAACAQCALADPCSELYTACVNSVPCQALDECYGGCGFDTSCQQGCRSLNPSGVATYDATRSCVYCDQCPKACAGYCSQ